MKRIKYYFVLLCVGMLGCSSSDDTPNPQNPDPDPIIEDPSANLSLTKTVNNSTPFIGDNVIFTITISNQGPDAATGVQVTDVLPSGYTFVSDNGATATTYDETTGIWTLPTLAASGSASLSITAVVNSQGNYINSAEITASTLLDPNSTPGNNAPSEDDQDTASTNPQEPSPVEVTTYAILQAGDGVTIDNAGNVYAANYVESVVYKIDTNQAISTFAENQPGAAGMVFGDDGNMYLARYSASDIARISPDGSTVDIIASAVASPIAVEFDSNGNLYTNNNFNSTITKIDPDGNKTVINVSAMNNSTLTLDDEDNIYISDYDNGIIHKIDAETGVESTFTTIPLIQGGISFIVYSQGYFYATAIMDHVVYKIDSNGAYEIIAGTPGVAGVTDGNGFEALFEGPNGIVVSPDGNTIYVAQGGVGLIRKITGFLED